MIIVKVAINQNPKRSSPGTPASTTSPPAAVNMTSPARQRHQHGDHRRRLTNRTHARRYSTPGEYYISAQAWSAVTAGHVEGMVERSVPKLDGTFVTDPHVTYARLRAEM
jgi:hypothetical protein